ncbi:hypothetical protein KY285_031967 [Solanum tuberosum]|nr:hypothetical protein KY285_031967 [Solanum tuberosum]
MTKYMPNMLEEQKKNKENAKRNMKSSGEDQGDSSKKILQNKRKQKIIYGEFESLGEDNPLDNYSATLIDNNIDNTCLYPLLHACECTSRLSPIEDEYNWNRPTEEDLNMNHLANEDSSIKTNEKNVGCERKGRNNNGEKDVDTSSP